MKNTKFKSVLFAFVLIPTFFASSCGSNDSNKSALFKDARTDLKVADYFDYTDMSTTVNNPTVALSSSTSLNNLYAEASSVSTLYSGDSRLLLAKNNEGRYWVENAITGFRSDLFDSYKVYSSYDKLLSYYVYTNTKRATTYTCFSTLNSKDKIINVYLANNEGFLKATSLSFTSEISLDDVTISQNNELFYEIDKKVYGIIDVRVSKDDSLASSFAIEKDLLSNDTKLIETSAIPSIASYPFKDLTGFDYSLLRALPTSMLSLTDMYVSSEVASTNVIYRGYNLDKTLAWSTTIPQTSVVAAMANKKILFYEEFYIPETVSTDEKYFYCSEMQDGKKIIQKFHVLDLTNGNYSDVNCDFALVSVTNYRLAGNSNASENANTCIGGLVLVKTLSNNIASNRNYPVVINGEGKIVYDLSETCLNAYISNVYKLHDDRYIVNYEKSSTLALVDSSFRIISNISSDYTLANFDFSNKLLILKDQNNCYGAIDFSGRIVLDFKYDNLYTTSFANRLIALKDNNYLLINIGDVVDETTIGSSLTYSLVDKTAFNGACLFKNIDGNYYSLDVNTSTLSSLNSSSSSENITLTSLGSGLLMEITNKSDGGYTLKIIDYKGTSLYSKDLSSLPIGTSLTKYYLRSIPNMAIELTSLKISDTEFACFKYDGYFYNPYLY